MLRGAVVDRGGVLELDLLNGQVQISVGVVACPLRMRSLFSIKPRMWTQLARAVQQPALPGSMWGESAGVGCQTQQLRGEMAAAWIREWVTQAGCYLPNATKEIQIQVDAQTKDVIWRLFLHEQPRYAITYQHFCKVFNEESERPPVIRMKKKKDVSSPCAECLDLISRLHSALESKSNPSIEAAKAACDAHYERVRAERRVYASTVVSASQHPPRHLSIVSDIMDQKKCQFPNWKGPLAMHMAGSQRMPLKLLGLTEHGAGWFAFVAPPWVPKGANLTCSALYLYLINARARGALPPVLKWCVDGGSENWCKTVFDFAGHLVTAGVFKEIWISRMPVGHTHNDQDQAFSRVSVSLHGASNLDTGRSSVTLEEWKESVRLSFTDPGSQPDVVLLSSLFDFDSFYSGVSEPLSGYGPSIQCTAAPGEAPRMEPERRSHLRVALIRVDPGETRASIRFAASATSAERGEWYPTVPGPTSLSPPRWCSLAGHKGVSLLSKLPSDEPTRRRFVPSDWAKFSEFQLTLLKAEGREEWTPAARAACRSFLANPPCALAVPWDLTALLPPPPAAPAPMPVSLGERRLIVCPLLYTGRTKAQKQAEERAAGCRVQGRFDVPFEQLEVGDFVFALAAKAALNSCTLRVCGKTTPPFELLEIVWLSDSGPRRVCSPQRSAIALTDAAFVGAVPLLGAG